MVIVCPEFISYEIEAFHVDCVERIFTRQKCVRPQILIFFPISRNWFISWFYQSHQPVSTTFSGKDEAATGVHKLPFKSINARQKLYLKKHSILTTYGKHSYAFDMRFSRYSMRACFKVRNSTLYCEMLLVRTEKSFFDFLNTKEIITKGEKFMITLKTLI